ncbi:MAG: MBL fold metallo-hydrolase [Pseudobdellovibrio sp.]
MKLQFLGAAGTVTGSKYLLTCKNKKILIDCGLFQGLKALRLKNWDKFLIEPNQIDAVILTHGHIDHSGYIPRLVKNGYRGKIYSTEATKEVCKILLPDCGYLNEEEAIYLNKIGKTKHKPALPLFTAKEAEASLQYFEGKPFEEKISLGDGITFEFRYAGHILGAASIVIECDGKKIAFTGDIGRQDDKIFFPPALLPNVDYLVTESTYGNRLHENSDPIDEIGLIVNEAIKQNGVIIIPVFAVGRAQAIMFYLSELRKENRIPEFPIYLNSPMATDFGVVFRKYKTLHKLSEVQCSQIGQVIKIVRSIEESKSLNERKGPMIIISASGMLTGGRVLHHLKAFVSNPKTTILLTGYQSAGTRGEALQNGAREIKIHGGYIPVHAQVKVLDNVSAHADYQEIIKWFTLSKIQPKKVFVTHGELSAADELRRRLEENFNWDCSVPEYAQTVQLE